MPKQRSIEEGIGIALIIGIVVFALGLLAGAVIGFVAGAAIF